MNARAAVEEIEIVTLPIGNGWRVRISDGKRLQFVGGFEDKSKAEEWMRQSAPAWAAKLRNITKCL